ncbi:serine/threonine protein kinase with WD-40 repeats (plasmid) [Leptolyngbya boryana NIES-2135]|jgi:serine/threonine protein kinase|uniref:non-specific serine/threonine protein kinase n=1 Tax=Leptolyngbya boryana NIES-2135 TaxID=1973484 RepID=A0A1Z4JT68_LEPBY|nr:MULTISPECIES: serine/threonine-protein kinase [Leptolyngbya]BAY59880.1 serine/threonine protein kinase with WD-40 repeats [Leptolyngbya boryana NIES-2135]MBD2369568.1 protein kinase [Leptolyngbya sp. FACHB-161]MBD2375987.1 protein kinase [Leptolyngbya sp. FACHB-238]MBD2400263.1 protein kinase [Leptolyngbya sp. FACHB-239]MBD2406805.1 protein kinase [Leptolyngbya sp. FACHB-402]
MIGKLLIGRYLVLEQIGAGSFSKTFLTLDKYLPQSPLCVVKSLNIDPEQDLSIEQIRPLFEREAQILQNLGQKSDRVPRLLAYVEEDSQLYLVEEYINGTAIDQTLVQKQILTSNEVAAIIHEGLEILQVIHAQGLIYQDLKLNHLIRRHRDGKLVLIDFGAAIHVEDLDRENITFGTLEYSPIEQQNGYPTFSSDLYALGVCAIQLLTGVPPDQLQLHPKFGALSWKPALNANSVDPSLVAILDRLVAPRVSDRYSNTREVLAALQSLPLTPKPAWSDQNRISWEALKNNIRYSQLLDKWHRAAHPSWGATALLAIGAIVLAKPWLSTPSMSSAMAAQIATIRSNTQPLTLLSEQNMSAPAQYLAMTANQTILERDSNELLQLRDIRSGKSLHSFQLPSTVTTLISDSKGQWLVGKADQNQVWVWNTTTGKLVHRLQSRQPISNLILSSDERTLIATSPNQIQMWNLAIGKLTHAITTTDTEEIRTPLLHTPVNELVCVNSQQHLQVIDSQTGETKRVLAGHTDTIRQVLLSPDQRFLYSVGRDRILMWNLTTGELIKAFPSQSAQVEIAAVHENRMVTLHTNGALRIWNRETGTLQRTISSLDGQTLLSPDGRYVLNYAKDQHLRVLQIAFD